MQKQSNTQKEANLKAVQETFDNIINESRTDLLPHFLNTDLKGHSANFKKHLNKCRHYWLDYINLTKEPGYFREGWGMRGNKQQEQIILWTAVAVLDGSDIKSWAASGALPLALRNAIDSRDSWGLDIIRQAKPGWLVDMFLNCIRQKTYWWLPQYDALLFLEENQLIEYHPELFAFCLSLFHSSPRWSKREKEIDYPEFILSHEKAYRRDVPELFNYETYFTVSDSENMYNPYSGNKLWRQYLKELITKGKLERNWVLRKSLETQTKAWNNGSKGFFRTLIEELEPQPQELIALQLSVFPLLQTENNTAVNFGINCCKQMASEKDFDAAAFADWIEPALLRTDIKQGIKNVLQILDKIAAKNKKLQPRLAMAAAEIFNVPVLDLQERAVKFINKYGDKKDEALIGKLELYLPQMQGKTAELLSAYLNAQTESVAEISPSVTYRFHPAGQKILVREIAVPQTWNNLLYSFGKFISSDNMIDTEILWNAYCTQRNLFPKDYSDQLQPYLKQLPQYDELYCTCYKCATESYLKTKIQDINQAFVLKKWHWLHEKEIFHVTEELLKQIDAKITTGSSLPLLSFPTHLPYWIAPKTLLERMIAYQNAGEEISKTDLAIAISRMPREQVEQAIPLLDTLHGELKALMAFCLGVSDNIEFSTEKNNSEAANTGMAAVWATAARTYYPDGIFNIFKKTYLCDVPFAETPLMPDITFEERRDEYYNWQTKEKSFTPSWRELHVTLPDFIASSSHFLYAADMYGKSETLKYLDGSITSIQAACIYSLMPQNNDTFAIYILQTCTNAEGAKEGLNTLLSNIGEPGFQQRWYSSLAWACCFFQAQKELRAKAAEVLYNQIAAGDANVELLSKCLAFFINNKYGVFSRMSDALLTIKDSSPMHNDALFQMMDGILAQLSLTELPTGFKKILEACYDLSIKTRRQLSPAALLYLNNFKEQGSLKKLIKTMTASK